MNKTVTIIAVLAIILLAGILFFSEPESEQAGENSGTVYVSVTDAAADMGNVSEVTMTTDSIELYTESDGWVTVSDNQQAFDLLALNESGESQLWAAADVEAGSYDRVRMGIESVTVTTTNGSSSDAILPSDEITLDGLVTVSGNATSSINLDVEADQSLHTADDGSYVFAPTVKMESRSNAHVSVDSNERVDIARGDVDTNVTVGVDLAGNSGIGVQVDPGEEIQVTKDGAIKLNIQPGEQGQRQGTSTRGNQERGAEAGASADVEAGAGASGSADSEADNSSEAGIEADVDAEAGAEVR